MLLPCIETAEGLVNTYAILKESPQLIGCLVASEDMTTSLQAPRDPAGTAIRYARERFLLECRAAGVEPVDLIRDAANDALASVAPKVGGAGGAGARRARCRAARAGRRCR